MLLEGLRVARIKLFTILNPNRYYNIAYLLDMVTSVLVNTEQNHCLMKKLAPFTLAAKLGVTIKFQQKKSDLWS